MSLSTLASRIFKVSDELRRPNLTTEDKGRLVTIKDQLTKAMSVEEQAAKKALETLNKERIAEVEYMFEEAKKATSSYSKAIQKELLNVQKGFESIERISAIIEQSNNGMYRIKNNETNRIHPATSQSLAYLQTNHIKASIVCDFFKALGVTFNNIDRYKNYFLTTGSRKENVNELIKHLSEMKLNKPDIHQWFLDHHYEKSRISQDVQEMMKEEL